MGVYFLWFGSKYYIGSTKKMKQRCFYHEKKLNQLINGMEVGAASIYNILKHVFIYLSIERGIMELVYEAKDELDLRHQEEVFLKNAVDDENCLNSTQKVIISTEKRAYPIIESIKSSLIESVNGCVFMLIYKDHFVVCKGKTLVGTLKNISRSIDGLSNKPIDEWPIEHLYYHFIAFILGGSVDNQDYKVQVYLVTDNPVDLLKKEQQLLWDNRNNPKCLNNTFDAYIPTYKEETQMYGWINKGQFMSFMRWKKRNMPQ
jgi:hypothetical protein